MNSNVSDSSTSSSSSSSDDDNDMMINALHQKAKILCHSITTNNMIIQHLLEQQNEQVFHGGSIPGHIVINRDRENAHHRLYNDYFSDNPVYNGTMFCRRYRMSRSLFIRIVDAVKDHDRYFQQRWDNTGRPGLSPIQKITVAFRMLAYGVPADATDEYIRIGESTAIESMKRFCRAMVEIFSERYLRRPTANDISILLYVGKKRGFPGMLGSLDCMQLRWKNCHTAWAG